MFSAATVVFIDESLHVALRAGRRSDRQQPAGLTQLTAEGPVLELSGTSHGLHLQSASYVLSTVKEVQLRGPQNRSGASQ